MGRQPLWRPSVTLGPATTWVWTKVIHLLLTQTMKRCHCLDQVTRRTRLPCLRGWLSPALSVPLTLGKQTASLWVSPLVKLMWPHKAEASVLQTTSCRSLTRNAGELGEASFIPTRDVKWSNSRQWLERSLSKDLQLEKVCGFMQFDSQITCYTEN